ncbi:MAG: DNA polymerase/3'-5' exonuclease PolX [Candidatus Woesearchaeota archaeon]|jgi:DNA polymerase (family 10)|nr:DNA polymerase/3'-5' exonuclease PolX [Candidatus Woesearchaeota archaeon]MDP7506052.1 DNA polymerase/3'-5' exonuclease PolX [Candidatus Woesearchaeota archaeon]MDP7610514.1 DNA polymerase/3'-5' exonuclease PolX [Candidatus Woesearchaeota archaeon]|tara:strand:+ start:911 stop:2611 length:1701 start_codon:yes stop_codon:yes gene_type:complete
MKNSEIARIFYEIADILEIQGIQWKPNVYRKAAQSIENLSEDIEDVYRNGKLEDVPGVGEHIAKKIEEIIKTGKLKYLKKLKKKVPIELEKMMSIPAIGPRTAKLLFEKLKVKNIKDLKRAAKLHKIRKLEGLGEKTEREILEGIKTLEGSKGRFLLGHVLPAARDIEEEIRKLPEVKQIGLAGSIRRMKETVHDVDILVSTNKPEKVIKFFTTMDDVKKVLAKGSTKASVKLSGGLQVDIRVVKNDAFGSAMQYFTGSKEHNIELRKIAIKKGFKLSEYGLFKGRKVIAGKKEVYVYKKLGLPFIEPELREDKGEIEAAASYKLPKLVKDVKGDLHVHTKWSDGSDSIEEIARKGIEKGYKFLGISDHVSNVKITHPLDGRRLLRQMKEIDKVNKKFSKITLLKGAEVDIDKNGKLVLKESVLKKLDFVIASVHSGFKSSETEMTDRMVKAMENPYVNVIGHPTGMLMQKRKPYAVNFERVFDAAKANNVALEINAFPNRLDLNDVNARAAKEYGVKLIIGTDSHSKEHLDFMELGVGVARRAWCSSRDVVNCLSLSGLRKWLKK